MKQVLVRGGGVLIQQVPTPQVSPRHILVKVSHSCISPGTEIAGVKMSGLPLYRRALKQPQHVKRVLQIMRDQGVKRTWDRVTGQLAAGLPTGYSASGVVIEVGRHVEGFTIGDRVACAGAGIANHAEVIDVPVNLATLVPPGIGTDLASTVTLGAIALQGVRRANPTLGETFVVFGLGLLGQITAQLLKINGCRVAGVDLDQTRVELAVQNGMDWGISPEHEDFVDRVHKLTGGFGADGVIVTAATSSHEPISMAMQACRKKGRVVLVGDVGLNLARSDFYAKEIDFLISCSYGPGRYDPVYEDGGQDYPLPYVRWTENRNMETYLRLIAEKQISLANLNADTFPIDQATAAYESLKHGGKKPLIALLAYPESSTSMQRTFSLRTATGTSRHSKVRVAVVGAGSFAQAMHMPNMVKLRNDFALQCVMSRTGANARAAAEQYGAAYATSDYEQVLNDPNVDMVMITTRHNLHGNMVLQGLRAGKHVFVEKPLTIFREELNEIEAFYRDHQSPPMLTVGFNRRFSPAIARVNQILAERTTPMIVNYRMNAGFIGPEHWVQGEEGGGRNIGEACHIYDLFNALTGSEYVKASAQSIVPRSGQWLKNDNFMAAISYMDGSVCSLTYTSMGAKAYPKESMEVFADGKVISLSDYKQVEVVGGKYKGWRSIAQEKGQFEELKALADCLLREREWPIPFHHLIQATRVSLAVEEEINGSLALAEVE